MEIFLFMCEFIMFFILKSKYNRRYFILTVISLRITFFGGLEVLSLGLTPP